MVNGPNITILITSLFFIALFVAGCTSSLSNLINKNNTNINTTIVSKPTERQNVSCASNAAKVANGSINDFNPNNHICKDDCKAADPNSMCDSSSCTCISSCANNWVTISANGIINKSNTSTTFNSSLEICKDDCKRLNPAAICDAKICACKIPVPVPTGCVANTMITNLQGLNNFNPAVMICQNDCLALGPNFICNAQCICQKPNPNPLSCAANSKAIALGAANNFNAATMICKDDCNDRALKCDAKTCTCQKPPPIGCIGNTISVASGNRNNFDLFGGVACKDDCKTKGQSLICDQLTCICKEGPINQTGKIELPCATNTILNDNSGAIFNSNKYICKDNCKEIGSDLQCNLSTCLCKQKNTIGTSCAQNTRPTTGNTLEKAPLGIICKDDCAATFGSAYQCNPLSCQCIKPLQQPEVSCVDNRGNAYLGNNTFVPGVNICKDDCSRLGSAYSCDADSCSCVVPSVATESRNCYDNIFNIGKNKGKNSFDPSSMKCEDNCKTTVGSDYLCDPQGCFCKPKPNITEGISCASNSYDNTFGHNNKFTAGMQCKDDCQRLGSNQVCDGSTCTCKEHKPVTCSDNTFSTLHTTGFKNNFDLSTMICKDNCEEKFGSDYSCDSQCFCKPKPNLAKGISCASNSYDSDLGHNNKFTAGMICQDDCQRLGSEYCDADTCTCKPQKPPEPIKCSAKRTSEGETLQKLTNGFSCEDDCKSSLGSDYNCDATSCTCIKTYKSQSCASNTVYKSSTGSGFIDPSKDICKDDCKTLDPALKCDPNSCICVASFSSGGSVSCGINTLVTHSTNGMNTYDSKIYQCKDDCEKNWGAGSKCDGTSCTCSEPISITREVYCGSNTFVTQLSSSGKSLFDSKSQICIDNCKTIDSNLVCGSDCTCKPFKAPDSYSCVANSVATSPLIGQDNTFDPSLSRCEDDCKNHNLYGKNFTCDAKTCKCKLDTRLSCASNSIVYGFVRQSQFKVGMECKDDCKEYGPGTLCDPNSCLCISYSSPPPSESCASRSAGYTVEKLAPGIQCRDDCEQSDPGSKCDPVSCKCVFPKNVVNDTNTSRQYHSVCSGYQCKQIEGSGLSTCSSDKDCAPAKVAVCGDNIRDGTEQCDGSDLSGCTQGQICTDKCQCFTPIPEFHFICSNYQCKQIQGYGNNECSSDADCKPAQQQYHTICDHGSCTQIQGAGTSQCASNSDCVPPVINCPAYCSSKGYEQFGGGYSTAEACSNAAQEPATACYTTCIYTKFYTASNQAGTTTCCCKAKKQFACTGCPGPNSVCPDQSICQQNQPG